MRAFSRSARLSWKFIPAVLLTFWTAGRAHAIPSITHETFSLATPPLIKEGWGIFLTDQQPGGEDPKEEQQASNGVNLQPDVRNLRVEMAVFSESSHDVQDGCVTPGEHRLLRFDFWVINIGTTDLVLGSPRERPEFFVWSTGHSHYHLKDFNEFTLYDATYRTVAETYKQPFCLFDSQRIAGWARSNRRFTPQECDNLQGISAGWADLYRNHLTCQYVVIDDLPEGYYALLATTNSQEVVTESSRLDNTICAGLYIQGNRVSTITHGFCEDWEILKIDPGSMTPEAAELCRIRWLLPCHK